MLSYSITVNGTCVCVSLVHGHLCRACNDIRSSCVSSIPSNFCCKHDSSILRHFCQTCNDSYVLCFINILSLYTFCEVGLPHSNTCVLYDRLQTYWIQQVAHDYLISRRFVHAPATRGCHGGLSVAILSKSPQVHPRSSISRSTVNCSSPVCRFSCGNQVSI